MVMGVPSFWATAFAISALPLATSILLDHSSDLQLPSFEIDHTFESDKADLGWQVRVDNRVFHTPRDYPQLSDNVEDYFAAMGSRSALTSELRERRVGGEGRWHIFHLPEGGPAALADPLPQRGSRRQSLSNFIQLRDGAKLSSIFPVYNLSLGYTNPLSSAAQKTEAQIVDLVDVDAFQTFLEQVTSVDSRSYKGEKTTAQAVQVLQEQFKAAGFQPCLHAFTDTEGNNRFNVMALSEGTTRASSFVVVGAHFDSRPYTGAAPGAEDNGSGVAALLAMARAFRKSEATTKKSLLFVGWNGEEVGLYGSTAFVADVMTGHLKCTRLQENATEPALVGRVTQGYRRVSWPVKDVTAVVMDEVGWRSPKLSEPTVNLEAFDWTIETLDHLAASSMDHNGQSLVVTHSGNPFGSDHMSFLEKNISAVLLINADDEAYPYYHKSEDTIENVDAKYAVLIARMNLGAALRMAKVN
eukprot:TRINITY_DN49851_c0_g1_i1.p1 TRINITY_DN49851_c0_g1~~TRINITY_DN49851_c0_g1_i1.p1  ORF type:complete len:470 (+),score=83.52 TRINITY_DN49851_c0_g1_i1:81-1490(+)